MYVCRIFYFYYNVSIDCSMIVHIMSVRQHTHVNFFTLISFRCAYYVLLVLTSILLVNTKVVVQIIILKYYVYDILVEGFFSLYY